MISIDEMQEMLEKIAQEVPEVFFRELNGGISLLEDTAVSAEAVAGDLFTLGEYCEDEVMGRFIVLYYGSFRAVFADADEQEIEAELRETLFHEFTHHLESLAGEYGLEEKDAAELEAYLAECGSARSGSSAAKKRRRS